MAAAGHCGDDAGDLVNGFALAEDHFGPAGAEWTVMVQAGVAQVLVGQVAQGSSGGGYVHAAVAHLFEKRQQGSRVHD